MSLIYDLVAPFGALAAAPAFLLKSFRHPEYLSHLPERCGRLPEALQSKLEALPCRPAWVQAVSVGEVMLARTLIEGLTDAMRAKGRPLPFLLSSTTPAGRALASTLEIPDLIGAAHFPLDLAPFASRALDSIRPRALLCVEAELWPALLSRCRRRGVPVLIANARLSEKSARRLRRAGRLLGDAIASIRFACAQSEADADRLVSLGIARDSVAVTGNMKFDLPVAPGDTGSLKEELGIVARREGFTLVAGSTSPGEEEQILDAVAECGVRDLLTIIAPRHRERFSEVARLLESRGLPFVRRTSKPGAASPFILLDSVGELAGCYALADAAFVGGSLVPRGGQNLIEPAARGVPVLFGPHTENFASVARALIKCGAGRRVENSAALASELRRLASDPEERRTMGLAGRALVERHRGAAEATIAHLLPFLVDPNVGHV